jgi:hypothetical protein
MIACTTGFVDVVVFIGDSGGRNYRKKRLIRV